jgi:Holliday junction resolvase RusA-like endonuclease
MSKFTIPGRLPGMNEYTAANRRNAYEGARMKRKAQDTAELAIKAAGLKPVTGLVKLHYYFYEQNKRRDLDNVSGFAHKVIQDALVHRGILIDDGWDEIAGFSDDFSVDRENPRIEIVIEPVDNGT